MKISIAIIIAALALVLPGCGGDDTATGSGEKEAGTETVSDPRREPRFPTPADQDDPHFPTISYEGEGRRASPVLEPSDMPPPKRLLVRDLRVGTGPVAYHRDEVTYWFIGFHYKTGKEAFFTWRPPAEPWTLARLGAGSTFAGMEEGIEGMREGGRREIIVPAHRGFGTGALNMIVDLIRVVPNEEPGED